MTFCKVCEEIWLFPIFLFMNDIKYETHFRLVQVHVVSLIDACQYDFEFTFSLKYCNTDNFNLK